MPIGDNGSALLPSVVAIAPDGAVTVGERAIEMEPHLTVERDGRVSAVGFAGGEYGAVIRSVKRYMGLGGDEIAPEDRARYTFADLSGPVVRFQIGKRAFTPSQISAEILRALKDGAERALAAGKTRKSSASLSPSQLTSTTVSVRPPKTPAASPVSKSCAW